MNTIKTYLYSGLLFSIGVAFLSNFSGCGGPTLAVTDPCDENFTAIDGDNFIHDRIMGYNGSLTNSGLTRKTLEKLVKFQFNNRIFYQFELYDPSGFSNANLECHHKRTEIYSCDNTFEGLSYGCLNENEMNSLSSQTNPEVLFEYTYTDPEADPCDLHFTSIDNSSSVYQVIADFNGSDFNNPDKSKKYCYKVTRINYLGYTYLFSVVDPTKFNKVTNYSLNCKYGKEDLEEHGDYVLYAKNRPQKLLFELPLNISIDPCETGFKDISANNFIYAKIIEFNGSLAVQGAQEKLLRKVNKFQFEGKQFYEFITVEPDPRPFIDCPYLKTYVFNCFGSFENFFYGCPEDNNMLLDSERSETPVELLFEYKVE